MARKHSILSCVVSLSTLLAASSAVAQDEQPASIFLDETEVNVVNVDVVVADQDGWPVTGLRAEDFVLLENGVPVPISNFYAIENGRSVDFALPEPDGDRKPIVEPAAVPAHLLVYVDNTNLSPTNRRRVLSQLRQFLRENWTDALRVSLVSNDSGLVINQSFTSEQRRFFAALDRLEERSSGRAMYELEENTLLREISAVDLDESRLFRTPSGPAGGAGPGNTVPGQTNNVLDQNTAVARMEEEALALVPQLRAFASARSDHLRSTLGVLLRFIDATAGVPGRKAVLHVSDGLEMRPGEQLFESFQNRFRRLPRVAGRYSAALESAAFDLSALYQDVVARANAARVTFYTIDASIPTSFERTSASSAARPTRDMRDWDLRFSTTADDNQDSTLLLMAEGTGGRAAVSPSALGGLLESSLADFENYYSLGFQIPATEPATEATPREQRRLEVRTKIPDLRRRYRRSGLDKSADEQMAERTMSGLLLDAKENPLDVVLRWEPATASGDGTFVVAISVQVPIAKLVLLPSENVHQAQVAVFVAVLDGQRRTSEVSKNLCPIRVRNEDLPSSMSRSAICGLRLRVREGQQRVAIGIRDDLAAIGSVVSVDIETGPGAAAGGG